MFQSSPDPKAGRNNTVDGRNATASVVPILARPEGRAQLPVLSGVPIGVLFQSSPDPKAGRNRAILNPFR